MNQTADVDRTPGASPHQAAPNRFIGRLLFAATLIVFGIEHFLYARGVGTMIPI